MLRAYFTCKPSNLKKVEEEAKKSRRNREKPVTVNVIGRVRMNLDQYIDFSDAPLRNRDYFEPFAEKSVFHGSDADCVVIECPGMPRIPVVLEGYSYGRYVGWLEGLIF